MAVNTTISWAINSTEIILNSSTTMEELETENDGWPHFRIFGKTYCAFIIIIASVGLVGNILSLVLMGDSKVNLFAYCIYMRWLAVSDSIVLIAVGTEDITDTYGYLEAFMSYNSAVCKLWTFVEITVRTLSPWLMVALTLDRFICVLSPALCNRFCTKTKAIVVCVILTFISSTANIGALTNSIIKDGVCDILKDPVLVQYVIFQNLIGISLLPCLAILILNVVLVTQIRKSFTARNRFELTDTVVKKEQNKSTLPLILVSIFAFITLVPIAVTQVVEFLLEMKGSDDKALRLANELWPLFNLIYLLNFAHNFYILMASSPHYRQIMAIKMRCFNFQTASPTEESILLETSNTEIRET